MKNKPIALAALVSLIGLAQTGTVEAGPKVVQPKTSQHSTAPRTQARKARPAPQQTDVHCFIKAFADVQATTPIQKNTTLVNPEQLWIRFDVKNGGGLPARGFKNALSVRVDGKDTLQEEYVLDVLPHFTATSGMIKIDTSPNDSGVEVALEVDTEDVVPDFRPVNDRCTFSIKIAKLQ